MIFPQVDADAITKAQIDPQQLYTGMQWEAVDVLDSHWLWLEADSDPAGAELEVEVGERMYDWRFFQQSADSANKSIVVFFVEDIPLDERLACEGKPYYDIVSTTTARPTSASSPMETRLLPSITRQRLGESTRQ